MALADVYDALISARVYKPGMTHSDAVRIIRDGRGSHFDPDVVDAFLSVEDTFRNIALTFADRETGGEAVAVGPLRVLLVEDNPINREIMLSQLSAVGHRVAIAADGREALESFVPGKFDLVLTDIEMPGLDGYGLAAAIRSAEAEGATRTTVLAITASDFDLDRERARTAGLDGFMLKPLDLKLLAQRLRTLAGPKA
jgi:response regulator RpfG family c-di-GMP phosphodiesterase